MWKCLSIFSKVIDVNSYNLENELLVVLENTGMSAISNKLKFIVIFQENAV